MIDKISSQGLRRANKLELSADASVKYKKSKETDETIIDKADITAQDLRKASIEYYPLHAKRRREAREKAKKSSPSVHDDSKLPAGEKKERTPKFIPDTDDAAPSLSEIFSRESGSIPASTKAANGGYDVGPFEIKLLEDLGPLARVQNDWDIDGLKGKIPSVPEMNKVFDEVAADKSIPFEFLPDGCYARSHITAEKFVNKGINCAKLYVMLGDVDWDDPFYPFPADRLKAENKFTKGEWWYHVAPLTFARDEKTGKIEGYVIDPAVNKNKPMKAADWVKAFWSGDFKIQFDTTQADIYDPPMEDFHNYQPKEFSREKFDKYLPIARKTNKEYSEILAKIKEEYYAQHPDEKPEGG